MSLRAWLLIASLGLTFALSGQAQEQAERRHGAADNQGEPAKALPIPLPVLIIEDDEGAETRQRREAEARQREIDDLVAQQGMNAATQAMNDATQRMAFYSLLSTVLVAAGTALLIWTLCLTRSANKAARDAVDVTREIGEAQVRAYLSAVSAALNFENGQLILRISIRNCGQSPAISTSYRYRFIADRIKEGAVEYPPNLGRANFDVLPFDAPYGGGTIGAQSETPLDCVVNGTSFEVNGWYVILFNVEVSFNTVFPGDGIKTVSFIACGGGKILSADKFQDWLPMKLM